MDKKSVYAEFGVKFERVNSSEKIDSPEFGLINPLLKNGNSKVGKSVYTWSVLPTNKEYSRVINGKNYNVSGTCPCHCVGCYATAGFYNCTSTIDSMVKKTYLSINYPEFVERAINAQIKADNIKIIRIHASGDFINAAYVEMWNAAYADGIYLLALSTYRSKAEQEQEYKYYKDYKGEKYADSIAARPGWSEHQTGLAIDLYSKKDYKADTFDQSETFKWLSENAVKYGFILRYTKGNEDITGYHYESWHYRYLGKELAQKVVDSGLTYDEYYAFYLDN